MAPPMKTTAVNEEVNLHTEARDWQSATVFINDELNFIENLLKSYIYEPDTPNLFERLQNYQGRIKDTREAFEKLHNEICAHDALLGGIIESPGEGNLREFCAEHVDLRRRVKQFVNEFRLLKSEIFNYAGGILRKHKM